jgi:two-component system CheB/CheR fusion protein
VAELTVGGIGASAGGLDACTRLIRAIQADTGLAFILIQHLDPTHASMMVELLAAHTTLKVLQAIDGMEVAPGHLYVIPPAAYLAVARRTLRLTAPSARHGARLPFDFLLNSLAEEYGSRAVCVILSGTGADGSIGLRKIKARGGLVIAQDPAEATYNGMPSSAIATGDVDLVLPVGTIADALARHEAGLSQGAAPVTTGDPLRAIVDLLRTRTAHDFTHYKPGTLQRRIERRMAAAESPDMDAYLARLRGDSGELDLLAKDLLINVTRFFRDSKVFDVLAQTVIPDLVGASLPNQALRIWTAGCSTGEETYSLAMLVSERIAAAAVQVKLQIFASDVDADAIAHARDGLYPATIEADVTQARLARFFTKEEGGYRIVPELRAAVVFAVQDVLVDPPFSRLDVISCRNLLIYLRPDAQQKVIALFHFALRDGGLLLLGSSETAGVIDGRFDIVSKEARLYRRIGHSREPGRALVSGDGARPRPAVGPPRPPSRQSDLAEVGRRLVLEKYAPAAILINRWHECLFSMGPTDRYLRVAIGHPTHDLLAMARPELRTRLRSAIKRALAEHTGVSISGGQTVRDGVAQGFNIEVQPVFSGGEELLLVCFTDAAARAPAPPVRGAPPSTRISELEQELDTVRVQLRTAVHDLELANEEQKAINEEALSVNEEYQSTNEELLTSKEELQSLNEELTALNSQLQETLERQRKTADDLQNVLYSTDVATLFLDTDLKIRFFTPATRLLFAVIPGDLGRPLTDLHPLSSDSQLPADARAVLQGSAPIEREIEGQGDLWFRRRVSPYRAHDGSVEGVVITFNDITQRKKIIRALEVATRRAEQANLAKTRFLAAASHDLRQPLQTLALLQGMLAKIIEGDRGRKLIAKVDDTLGAMSGMLNALLDINQIESGSVQPEVSTFPVNDLLDRLQDAFTYHAPAKGLALRVVPCSLRIDSDPRLLEHILRNLVANALKYTQAGRVLIGCRRHADRLSIEVWDTGIGIPPTELKLIFEEYHQIDNPAREQSRGLGLGLAIVQRLAALLGCPVDVRSCEGRGSVFTVSVALAPRSATPTTPPPPSGENLVSSPDERATGKIMVVEDDPDLRLLLEMFLRDEGHAVAVAANGVLALDMVAHAAIRPDLVFVDYNLPGGLHGLDFAASLRARLGFRVPVVVLTGDISTETLRAIAQAGFRQINKPARLADLSRLIQDILRQAQRERKPHEPNAAPTGLPTVYVVDDDSHVRDTIGTLLTAEGYAVRSYPSGEAFLAAEREPTAGCLLVDAAMPGMSGLELLKQLGVARAGLPAIMITGQSDVSVAVAAMRAGAADFIEKPVGRVELLASIARVIEHSRDAAMPPAWRAEAARQLASLTPRQREVMDRVLAGHPSKNIAQDLAISQRTVENHRASIMRKAGVSSLPALARLAMAAADDTKPSP